LQEITDLSPAEVERLVKRLVHHALCKMYKLTWRGASLARGGSFDPRDFVDAAFAKVLAGERTWNKDEYSALEGFLRSVIDSDMNHLVDSIDNVKGRHLPAPEKSAAVATQYMPVSTQPEPATAVIDNEWPERQRKFHEQATSQLDGDQALVDLLECMEAGITEPLDIAVALGVTVDHINNEKKRLRRKLDKLDPRNKPAKKGNS
jgi:hypothetical protein